jgi:hypothetical protein
MRPLVVFTGQGIARADGFNLTRRLKSLPQLARLGESLPRGDRQSLDAILAEQALLGEPAIEDLLRALRALCLKERRSTLRKSAHHGVFSALGAAASARVVVHLTTCIDGLTTTFAVRDFGAAWPPFRRVAGLPAIAAEAAAVLSRGRGMIHLPAHGEAPLIAADGDELLLQSYFGEPGDLRGASAWASTLRLGLARGVASIDTRFPLAGLSYEMLRRALAGEPIALGDEPAVPPGGPADLVVIGYGACAARRDHPFERCIAGLRQRGLPSAAARWTAVVHRPEQNRRVASWFEAHGFIVAGCGDGDLADVVRRAVVPGRAGERDGGSEPPLTPATSLSVSA